MDLLDATKNKKNGICDRKPEIYYHIYHNEFHRIRNFEINLLEIGTRWGGSIWAWREYFPNAKIYGLDVDIEALKYSDDDPINGVKIYSGDQMDLDLLEKINEEVGGFDIIIDDGGHTMEQQITSFNFLFPKLNNNGIYVVEDLETSYWPSFGGGLNREGTMIEYLKTLIDKMNATFHNNYFKSSYKEEAKEFQSTYEPDNFDKSLMSIKFYEAIAFVNKMDRQDFVPIGNEIVIIDPKIPYLDNKAFEPILTSNKDMFDLILNQCKDISLNDLLSTFIYHPKPDIEALFAGYEDYVMEYVNQNMHDILKDKCPNFKDKK
mgnify:CR=1 FL=1